jgi:WD40 repeat protein
VTGGEDKKLRLWDLSFDDELEAVFKGHDHRVTRVHIDASGETVYSASSDGTLRIWDRRLGRAARQLAALDDADSPSAEISALANGPDGMVLIGYKDGTIRALDGQSLSLKTKPPPPHEGEVWAIAAADGTQRVASADFGGAVRIWNIESGEIESEDRLQMRKVYGLRYADPVRILCWGEPARTVGSPVGSVFCELAQPQRSLIAPALDVNLRRVRAAAFSPEGRMVFVGGQSGLIAAFEAEGRERWAERDTRGEAYSMSLSPNGMRLAYGGSDRVIRVRDVRTGRLLLELRGHLAAITSVAFASDGIRLVSASWDGTVRLWDTRESECLAVAHVPGISKMIIGADGKSILAGTTRGELVVLDLIGIAPLSAVTRVQSP